MFWNNSTEHDLDSVEAPSTTNNGYILNQDHETANYRQEGSEKDRDGSYFGWIRYSAGQLVDNDTFQHFVVLLISINAVMMGIATFDFVTEDEPVRILFDTVDCIFLIIFTVELGLQFINHGLDLFKDNWLVFDFFVILISWSIDGMQIVRAFRVVRAIRLVVRIKEMKNLVEALFNVMPRMFAIGCLLCLIFYIYGVMFTVMFKDLYDDGYLDQDYFSRLDKTFFTLFQLMTTDSWSYITKQVMVVYPYAWLPFITFILLSSFVVLNLVIAVICNAVSELQRNELEDKINHVGSELSDKNNITMMMLENKIDKLTALVQQMAQEKDQRVQIQSS